MKLLTVLAATAVAAAVAAALTISAGANPSAGGKAAKLANARSAPPARLVSCLRAHGLNPPDNLFRLKPWMLRLAGTDAGKAALKDCGVEFDAPQTAATGEALAACLRAHGADVPAGAAGLALKTWVREHSRDAKVMEALKRCGGGVQKAPAKASGCGGGAAAPARDRG